ncbi:MAG: hypothetical protein H0V01_09240 [Bacteroidetes bacterium]|nr:hypothetical protein [Bacteroidota bacterium]HET6243076.1 hypothetical protein [Bacteroidia bacterium]
MKNIFLLVSGMLVTFGFSFGQQKYLSMDATGLVEYGYRDGKLDSSHVNPKVNSVYNSTKCIQYKRSAMKFDNVKIHPKGKFENLTLFATFDSTEHKIKMKVYSTSPVGTIVEIQFAKKGIDNYPKGVHSQFQAKTKKQNEWEELTFDFVNTPEGSQVESTEIDEIVILFSPNATTTNIYYFSDMTGPKLIAALKE